MPCTRDTFVGRIKKIKTESCDNKLSMPHASLVLLVNKIMAEQEKKHKLQKEQYELKVRYLQIEWGASSRCCSSVNCRMWMFGLMTIGKTRPTLFPNRRRTFFCKHHKKLKEYTEKSPSDPSLKKPRNPQKSFHWNNEGEFLSLDSK